MLVLVSYLLVQWIVLSSGLILLNKHILSEAGFDFPCTLVLLHMLFCTACACVWRLLDWVSVPLLGGPRAYCARFVPIGLCFAASLGLGNALSCVARTAIDATSARIAFALAEAIAAARALTAARRSRRTCPRRRGSPRRCSCPARRAPPPASARGRWCTCPSA